MKILTNLIRPTSGRATVAGIDVQAHPMRALRRVGALIEVPGVYDYLTPDEVMAYFGRVHGLSAAMAKERTKLVLERVRMTEWHAAKIGGFSTGMTRRFFLALAMLHDPEVLILDEPVLGLDPKGMQDIRIVVKDLAKEGKTVLLSSHLLGEVAETCSRVIMINGGKVQLTGSVDELTRGQQSRRIVVEFLAALSDDDLAKVEALAGVTRVEMNGPHGVIEFDGARGVASSILSSLVKAGLAPVSFAPQQSNLEDLYVNMVGASGGIH